MAIYDPQNPEDEVVQNPEDEAVPSPIPQNSIPQNPEDEVVKSPIPQNPEEDVVRRVVSTGTPNITTSEEKRAIDAYVTADTYELGTDELIARTFGFKHGTTLRAAAVRMATRPKFEADPEFRWNKDSWAAFTADLDHDFHDDILQAKSYDEAVFIKADILRRLENEYVISSYGFWEGMTARVMADMTDPVFLGSLKAVGTLLGGSVKYVTRMAKGSKGKAAAMAAAKKAAAPLHKLYPEGIPVAIQQQEAVIAFNKGIDVMQRSYIGRGFASGATFAGVESIRAAESPIHDVADHAFSAAVTGAIIGNIHLFGSNRLPWAKDTVKAGWGRLFRRHKNNEFTPALRTEGIKVDPVAPSTEPITIVEGVDFNVTTPKVEVPATRTPSSELGPSGVRIHTEAGTTELGTPKLKTVHVNRWTEDGALEQIWKGEVNELGVIVKDLEGIRPVGEPTGDSTPAGSIQWDATPYEIPKTPAKPVAPDVHPDVLKVVPIESLTTTHAAIDEVAHVSMEPASMEMSYADLNTRAKELGVKPTNSTAGAVENINKEISRRNTFEVTQEVADANPRLAAAPNVKVVASKAEAPVEVERAWWSEERLDWQIKRSTTSVGGQFENPKTGAIEDVTDAMSNSAVAWIDPLEFVRLTTTSEAGVTKILETAARKFKTPTGGQKLGVDKMDGPEAIYGEFDYTKMGDFRDPTGTPRIYLRSDGSVNTSGVIEGAYQHEGRHRMAAMHLRGVKEVPVLLNFEGAAYETLHPNRSSAVLKGQRSDREGVGVGKDVSVVDIMPLARANRAKILERMGKPKAEVPKAKVIPKMQASDPATYSESLAKTRAAFKLQGKNVDLQVSGVSDLEAQSIVDAGGTLLLSEDGMMGGYVTADGYMGGIFSHPEGSGGAAKGFMAEMERLGGTHGESYAVLEPLYVKLGWKPVSRIKFNVKFAPKGWDAKDSVLKDKPDVVFYSYEPKQVHTEGEGVYAEGDNSYDIALSFAKNRGEVAKASRAEAPALAEPPVEPTVEQPPAGSIQTASSEQVLNNLDVTTGKLWGGKNRKVMPSLQVQGMLSEDAAVRWITQRTHQSTVSLIDPVTGKELLNNMTAVTAADDEFLKLMNPLAATYREGYKQWSLEQGSLLGATALQAAGMTTNTALAFDKLAAQVIRGTYTGNDPIIIRVGEAGRAVIQASNKKMVGKLTEEPFTDLNHLPRNWNLPKMHEMRTDYGGDEMELLTVEAVASGNPTLSVSANKYKGKLLARDLYQRTFKADYQSMGIHNGDSRMETKAKLEALEAPPDTIRELLNDFFPPSKSPIKSLRPRTKLDEGYSKRILNKTTGKVDVVTIESMFEGGMFSNIFNATRSIEGALQVHKLGLEFQIARGITDGSSATMAEMWKVVEKSMVDMQQPTASAQEHWDLADKYIMAKPIYDSNTPLAKLGAMGRASSAIVIGGSLGFAATAETFMPLVQTSLSAVWKQLPAFSQLLSIIKSGRPLPNTLMHELQTVAPTHTDRLMSQVSALHESTFDSTASQGTKQDVLNRMQQGVYIAGGMVPITDVFRNVSNAALAQYVYTNAVKGKVPYSTTRLAQYGLTPERFITVQEMLLKHGVVEKGSLVQGNWSKWENTQAVSDYATMQLLHTNRVIHQVMAGQVPEAATGPVAKVLTQFLTFPMTAVDSQVMANLQGFDRRAALVWLGNLTGGALSYILYVHHRYGADEEKLEEYLTMEEIAKGAFYRSGMSTIMPFAIDTARDLYGESPMFSHSRTGLVSDVWGGTPTASLLKNIQGTARSAFASVTNPEYRYSKQDWNSARNLIPLQNSAWLHRGLSEVPELLGLPDKSKNSKKNWAGF